MAGHQRIKTNALAYIKNWNLFEFVYSIVTIYLSLLNLKQGVVNYMIRIRIQCLVYPLVIQCCEELKKRREKILRLIPCVFICIDVELLRNQA